MKAIKKIFSWIDTIAIWLAVLSLILTFALVFLNVVLRYIFGTGFAWSEEGARYALMAVIILGVLQVTHNRSHFSVDLLTGIAPKPVLRVMMVLQDIIMIGVMCILTHGSYKMVLLNAQNTTPAIGMPSWIPYGLMLVSCAVSTIYLVGHLIEDVTSSSKAEASEEGNEKC